MMQSKILSPRPKPLTTAFLAAAASALLAGPALAQSETPPAPALHLASANEAEEALSVDDFLVDLDDYTAKTFTVRGSPECDDEHTCYLHSEDGDDRDLMFDASKLGEDERQWLFGCNNQSSPCDVILSASGISDPEMPEITPNRIDWAQNPQATGNPTDLIAK